ncbi:MAG: heme ABC exporter ATP-binding protein CcmA [Hyphomicrobiaceae bacterium]
MKLVVENLRLERGARAIVADLTFAVASGEALLLTGANGAGKSTLLRALAGLFTPASGTIRLDGLYSEATVTENCHFIGHHNGLKSSLTATENLSFWSNYLGTTGASRVATALDRMQLASLEAIPAAYMSAGQKRRLGLARLLVAERPVWLLDEPTVSLDQASARLLGDLVNAHVASGGIAIAATHLPLGLTNARELRLTAPLRTSEAAP